MFAGIVLLFLLNRHVTRSLTSVIPWLIGLFINPYSFSSKRVVFLLLIVLAQGPLLVVFRWLDVV